MARQLKVDIIGDASSLENALGRAGKASSGFASKLGTIAKAGAAAAIVAATVVLEQSIKAAMAAETSQSRLDQAFKNAGLSAKASAGQIDAAEAASRKLGFTDTDVRTALGSLITATGDVGKSMKDLAVAQDLARFKGVALGDATKMMTMAMTGSQRAAKQLGITVIPLTTHLDALKRTHLDLTTAAGKATEAHAKLLDKMATGQAVIDAVNEKVHGQGQAFADTAAGGMAQFHAQVEHLEVSLGQGLLPTVAAVAAKLADFVSFLQTSKGVHDAVRGSVDALKSAWAALQPIVEAVGAAIQKHWPQVEAAAKKVVDYYNTTIRPAFENVAAVLEAVWARFGGAITKITTTFLGSVLTIVRAVMIVVKDAVDFVLQIIQGHWGKAWHDLVDIVSTVLHAAVTVVRGFVTVFVTAATAVGKAVVHGIVSGLSALLGKVEQVLQNLGKAIISIAGEAYGWALGIGKALVRGVLAGITSLPGELAGKLHGYISSAIHFAGNLLKGSGEFMFTIHAVGMPLAAGVVQGFEQGMKDGLPRIRASLQGVVDVIAADAYRGVGLAISREQEMITTLSQSAKAPSQRSLALASGIGVSGSGGQLSQSWLDSAVQASLAANPNASTGGVGPGLDWSGLSFASGGVVPGSGPRLAVVHGGERVIPAGRGGGGVVNNFSFPNYVGSKQELEQIIVKALAAANRRGSVSVAIA